MNNVCNAVETALFYKCLPNKSMVFKTEQCHGGGRVTIMLAINMTGTEKLKPFVIGTSRKIRCVAGIKTLSLAYAYLENG